MKFTFDSRVYDLGVRGVYFNIRGMQNRPSDDPAVAMFINERLALIPPHLEASPIIHGFRHLHAVVSTRPDKLMSAPANLLQFYRSRNDIPRINGIVDVYNAVSISSGLAIGAHDLAYVDGDIELRLTRGDEHFLPLGTPKPVRVPPGEYAYIDSRNDVLCRLEVRQVDKTKVTLASHDVFFIVQGHAEMEASLIQETASCLSAVCLRLFGGSVQKLYP